MATVLFSMFAVIVVEAWNRGALDRSRTGPMALFASMGRALLAVLSDMLQWMLIAIFAAILGPFALIYGIFTD